MQNYIEKVKNLQTPTFQQIRNVANSELLHLTNEEKDELWRKLNRGVDLLNSNELMCQYLWSFGNMHEARIHEVCKYLPKNVFNNKIEIIDWGCGQALGTICFLDYLKRENVNYEIERVILIEPSSKALERAKLHVQLLLGEEIEIVAIQKYLDDVNETDIQPKESLPRIHFFSNILDIPQIDLKRLSSIIDNSVIQTNHILAVGPLNYGNLRIDAFYNYFNVPLIKEWENPMFPIGNNKTKTLKAKLFSLSKSEQGNLYQLDYYPSVQFYASYLLDAVKSELLTVKDDNVQDIIQAEKLLNAYEVSSMFDIGASIYEDVHPILAVLNNLIIRGISTKASPYIEEIFQDVFKLSVRKLKYGTISFNSSEKIGAVEVLLGVQKDLESIGHVNIESYKEAQLELIFSPIAIARIQKTIIEAFITGKLSFEQESLKVLVKERDVPCAAIALQDLEQMFNNLTQLSRDFEHLSFPKIELDIINESTFYNSKLHLGNRVNSTEYIINAQQVYDVIIDISLFTIDNSLEYEVENFICRNNCYFKLRASNELKGSRSIYTTDLITYKNIVEKNGEEYVIIEENKKTLKYFLQLLFRKEDFRPGQLPILSRALEHKSVIGLLPTGGGKSLTYQIAALLQPGVTIIVDPLRSLMKDQYDGLINAGIDVCSYVNSSLTQNEKVLAESKMEESKLLFIFLSPERLAIYKFREKLRNMHLLNVYFSYGVIDEVHCVSEWGHDFRFSYLHLGRNLYNYVKAKNGIISLFGLTATASFDVLADVERELSGNGSFPLDSETIVRYENSNRLELQYKIEKIPINFLDELTHVKSSKFSSAANIDKIKTKYRELIQNNLPLPIYVYDKWKAYENKSQFLKEYLEEIPEYLMELQQKESLKYVKDKFEERQGNNEGVENDLKISISESYFNKKEHYPEAGIVFCPHKKGTGVSVKHNKESLIDVIPDIGTFAGGGENEGDDAFFMKNLELFRDNKQPLMVATKAFGMGIDKPNVRFTINLNYSSSLEGFVQEAGRGGRDRKMAISSILVSDYNAVRLKKKEIYSAHPNIVELLKYNWFKTEDFFKIVNFYKIKIDKSNDLEYLTPENDLVRLFCKDGTRKKYWGFNKCNDTKCSLFQSRCQLKKVPKEAENWIYKDELFKILDANNITVDKKHVEFQNADYETVMYFYNNSFKGEFIEKMFMFKVLRRDEVSVFKGDHAEEDVERTSDVKGFLTTLLSSKEGDNLVSFINYTLPDLPNNIEGTVADINKAIYRMTCIGLINDFTQDYAKNRFRIVSKRKKEGEYYNGLKSFLLRYYSEDRAEEEIQNVYDVKIDRNSMSDAEVEIFQCLSYLTSFVYDKISIKRKRAIDDMRTFCLIGLDETKDWKIVNEELKDFIFYYFNSKYAKEDYIADNGEDYSIKVDTDEGKVSDQWILFKYLKIINDNVEYGTPIDNVKHLQGAVRLLRRSLTDDNPTLSLLNAFCIFFLGTNNNENIEKELVNSYKEGMQIFAKRMEPKTTDFWSLFEKFNRIMKPFTNKKQFSQLTKVTMIEIHEKKLNKITDNYLA